MRWSLLAVLCWLAGGPLDAAGETLVDRVVAVVDEDPVLLSDIERIIALGFVEPAPGDGARELRRRVLDQLIDRRLRLHEVDRFDFGPLPVEEIERQLKQIRARFSDQETFEKSLVELGFDEEGVRYLLARQLRVLRYIEERLAPRVFVDVEDVRAYYEGELADKAAREGVRLPPLDEVREQIRSILRDIRLNEEIERWTEELRLQAEVLDFFDRTERELPPVAHRFDH